LWVLDLWPYILNELQFIKNKFSLFCIGKIVDFIYSKSDIILAQSDSFKEETVRCLLRCLLQFRIRGYLQLYPNINDKINISIFETIKKKINSLDDECFGLVSMVIVEHKNGFTSFYEYVTNKFRTNVNIDIDTLETIHFIIQRYQEEAVADSWKNNLMINISNKLSKMKSNNI
jgi:hypothetical protein